MLRRSCPPIALLLVAVMAIALAGCRNRVLISEDDMVRVLTKLYLTDASRFNVEADSASEHMLYYEPVLERYGYTVQQFDTSLRYYSSRPEVLDQIYDRVIGELTKLEVHIADEAKRALEEATRNLWPLPVCLGPQQADSLGDPHLRFAVQLPYAGHYALTFTMRRETPHSNGEPRFAAALWAPDSLPASMQMLIYAADTAAHSLVFEFDAPDTAAILRGALCLYVQAEGQNTRLGATFSDISLRYNPEMSQDQRFMKFSPYSLKRNEADAPAPQEQVKASQKPAQKLLKPSKEKRREELQKRNE